MTAVEWFLNELKKRQYFIGNDMLEAYNQALEMEKHQIIDAWNNGVLAETFEMQFEQYYNETYNKP